MKLNARFDGVEKRFAATMAENSASIGIDMGEVHIVPSTPGEPGISPIVEMQETAEGVDITITDAEGVKTATVKHGLKGEQGERGEKGEPGERGEPGYTPVKGTDYWTEEDRQSIVNETIAAMPEVGVQFETDKSLKLEDGVLSVNTTDEATEYDQRPITSQGVYNEFAVINALLKTI